MINLRDAIYSARAKVAHIASKTSLFLNSTVGKAVTRTTASLGAELIGLQAGQAFPQVTLGAHLGEAVADRLIPKRDIQQIETEDGVTITPVRSTSWKVMCVAASLAIAGGLNWVIAQMTDPEDPAKDVFMAQFILSTAGSIVGGMQAIRATQDPIPENYTQRTLQYFAGQGAVNFARQLLPTPSRFAFIPQLIGATAAVAAGTAGYHAQNLAAGYRIARKGPHEIIRTAINTLSPNLVEEVSAQVSSPLFQNTLKNLTSWGLFQAIEKPEATHFLIKCFNDYAKVIQTNPDVSEALAQFKDAFQNRATHVRAQANLVKKIQNGLPKKLKFVPPTLRAKIENLAGELVQEIPKWEKALFGFPLTDETDLLGKELRRIHLMLFLTYVAQRAHSLPSKKNRVLAREETEAFYSNTARLAIQGAYPEALPAPVQQVAVAAAEKAIEVVLPEAPSSKKPVSFLQKLAALIRKATSSIWGTLKKVFTFSSTQENRVDPKLYPRLARYYKIRK